MVSPETQELATRAEAYYETHLKASLEKSHYGAFLSIEPDSGDFYLGSSIEEVIDAARSAHPDRLCYVMRVTEDKAAVFLGGSSCDGKGR